MPDDADESDDSATTRRDTGEREYADVREADERTMLEGMLDWYRDGVVLKTVGLRPSDASRALVESGTSIAGLVKHLAADEDAWFSEGFAGVTVEYWANTASDSDTDWEFSSAADDDFDELVQLYRDACERSRSACRGRDLDELNRGEHSRPFTLRFAYVHMLEETARHLGHMDIIREMLDGSTGE
jgi:hypothetical protein